MKCKRIVSILLVLVIVVSLTANVFAKTGTLTTNTGRRHQLCTELSAQAKAYYTGNYTFEKMAALEGGSTSCLTTVDCEMYERLQTLMDTTMTNDVSYNSLTRYWPDTDANAGSSDAVLFYSDSVSGSYNREHVWPKSRASFHQQDGGCDLHHLRPTNNDVNSTRKNYTMGNVRGVLSSYSTKQYNGKDVLYYSAGNDLVEVNDNIKGDVARIFLYVYVRWGERNLFTNDPNPKQASNDSGGNNGLKVIESLETLLQWCEEDPVDAWEMGRNDQCENVQGNRNVFIDYPEFAWLLFGQDIPSDMKTPSGMAAEYGTSYTVTALSNNPDYGTVELNGKVVTATPNDGCRISQNNPYTLEGTATVTHSGNTFTLSSIKSDCTLTVNFEQKTPATITYIVPEGVTVSGVTASYVGDSVKLATVSGTPTGTEGYSFYCWSKSSVADTTSAPTGYAAGASYSVTASETTFHAVFRYYDGEVYHYLSNLCKHESTHTETIDPTCTAQGRINTVCDDCGAIVSYESIPAAGHDDTDTVIAPTCTSKGYTLHKCKNCGREYRNEYVDKLGHAWDEGTVTTKPTETEDGVMTYACTRCDATKTESIPATGPVHDPCDDYTDLDSSLWYHDGIAMMLNEGYMNGVGDGLFKPNGSLTRAQLVTILYRIADEPEVEAAIPFEDVASDIWYTKAVIWAAENGIVNGTSETTFSPNKEISREQIATILYRWAKAEAVAEDKLAEFADADSVSAWAVEAMNWAVSVGLISGSDGKLLPRNSATRAQIATILYRYLTAE